MLVDLDSEGQSPHVTRPSMRSFGASGRHRFAMPPGELQCAGLDRYWQPDRRDSLRATAEATKRRTTSANDMTETLRAG